MISGWLKVSSLLAVCVSLASVEEGCVKGANANANVPVITTPEPAVIVAKPDGPVIRAAAELAWAERDSQTKLRDAIDLWEQAVAIDPADIEVWQKLARAHYLLADGHLRFEAGESAEEEMLASFQQGIAAADKGLRALSPSFAAKLDDGATLEDAASSLGKDAVPLLYWRASNLGKWAAMKGLATLLFHMDEINGVMQVCLDRDPEYFYRGPSRYFGVFYARAPSFAGGDLVKARESFELSLTAHPSYLGTRTLLAEELAVKTQDRALFDAQLDAVLEADANAVAEIAPENRVEQHKAKLLKQRSLELFE